MYSHYPNQYPASRIQLNEQDKSDIFAEFQKTLDVQRAGEAAGTLEYGTDEMRWTNDGYDYLLFLKHDFSTTPYGIKGFELFQAQGTDENGDFPMRRFHIDKLDDGSVDISLTHHNKPKEVEDGAFYEFETDTELQHQLGMTALRFKDVSELWNAIAGAKVLNDNRNLQILGADLNAQ